MPIGDLSISKTQGLQNVKVSLLPDIDDPEKFDFDLHFDQSDFVGASSNKVKFRVVGDLYEDGANVGKGVVEGPVDLMKFEIGISNSSPTERGFEGKLLAYKSSTLTVPQEKIKVFKESTKEDIIIQDTDFKANMIKEI